MDGDLLTTLLLPLRAECKVLCEMLEEADNDHLQVLDASLRLKASWHQVEGRITCTGVCARMKEMEHMMEVRARGEREKEVQ